MPRAGTPSEPNLLELRLATPERIVGQNGARLQIDEVLELRDQANTVRREPQAKTQFLVGLGRGGTAGLLRPIIARIDGDVPPLLGGLVLIWSRTNLIAVRA